MLRSSFFCLLFLLTAGFLPGAAERLRLAGTDLARPALEPLVAAYNRGAPQPLLLGLDGSRSGLAALRAGQADFALLAFGPGEHAATDGLRVVPLAYQVAVFGVAEANPLRQASLAQLAALFGSKEPANYRQWGQVVNERSWAAKTVGLHAVANPTSLALDLFRYTALRAPALKAEVTLHATAAAALARVRGDETSLALLPGRPAETVGIHLLLVNRREDDVAFGPTPENIHAGDYPLRLPFSVAFRPERTAELLPALRFLFGDPVAAALAAADFVPVPEHARQQTLRELGGS